MNPPDGTRDDARYDARDDGEIETPEALLEALATGSLRGRRIQDLDLTPQAGAVMAVPDVEGLVVLGGRLPADLDQDLRSRGALVFPTDPHCPVNPYRSRLYTAEELYDGLEDGYPATPDARAHAWLQDRTRAHDALTTLLRAIHDDAVGDALTEALAGRWAVGVMGGHALERGTSGYADAARLGARLADLGVVVLTGGGPGAMEAANLGAFSGGGEPLSRALAALAATPGFRPDTTAWARTAMAVRRVLLLERGPVSPDDPHPGAVARDASPERPVRSIGIPTWFYGHEPPQVFADGIAKYFSNALREDGLLARATAGVVVLPGAAGTVQEVFQAATPLFYGSDPDPAPLVLVGHEHWTRAVPVLPALDALGALGGGRMASAVHVVADGEEACEVVAAWLSRR